MMESEILKFICANQGAVDTEYLLCNLGSGDSSNVLKIICNRDKFATWCVGGQPKVVARTKMRLCRDKECQGSCRGLHLCKHFLFTGSCQFSQRRGCSFSHTLDSEHNQRILKEHELESLDRVELCTLLLQSDDRILPPICYDYNNGDAEFGGCKDGCNCKRLHICEKYLSRDCSCFRTHDFSSPQPSTALQERRVPNDLFRSLKSVYANLQALKSFDKRGNKGNLQPQPKSSEFFAAACNADVWGENGLHFDKMEWIRSRSRGRGRGRGRGCFRGKMDNMGNRGLGGVRGNPGSGGNRSNRGNRGDRCNRGSRGSRGNLGKTCSTSDILNAVDELDLYSASEEIGGGNDQPLLKSSKSDTDTSKEDRDKTSTAARGGGGNRGSTGNRGNHQPLPRTRSSNDVASVVDGDAGVDGGPNRRGNQRPVRDKTEICMYFIKGHCKHEEERCFKAHERMPYRWQVRVDGQWTAMPDNEAVEKDFCDPSKTYSSSSSPPVHFDTMTCGSNKVRRLSTTNSLLEPSFIHTTEWVWYWEDEFGKWTMYASSDGGHKPADMDSPKLEQMFLNNDKEVVEFKAGSHSYSLSFQDMIQTNKHYGTKRLVRRRPRFASAADVQERRVRKPLGRGNFAPIPDHWDKTQIPQTGYKRVPLQRTSGEFKAIEDLFCETMRGFDIVKIERIQNIALWEVFQWQKKQMKNHNGGRDVAEKKLFHGTDNKYVDVICHTNFDWRLCGTHGTAFGKGSYFARDAKYSHSYTSDSDVKSMFIARLLVGEYTKGSSDYCRPPSKDGGDINFFDSCVDNVITPSIYVLFEKHQIYPEYLLQYKTVHPLVNLYGSSSIPTPKPAPAPAPRLASQPSTPAYKPSTSSYQPSTPAYKPSTASYQPSTASYQPSTASYQPSTASYLSSTSSYQPSTASYLSSTPSYQRSTVTKSSSPPPTSKKKKEENSCVIA